MSKKKLVVFGAGDIAQIANYYFEIDSDYEVVAFTVDKEYLKSSTFEGKPLVAFDDIEKLYPSSEHEMFIATSYFKLNKVRAERYHEAKKKGYKLATYISSKCTYLSQFKCGDNCFIFEDNTIQPYVKLGNNITLWSGNHIGHHSVIEDHNFITSHVVVSGHCHIGPFCFLGVNATLHNNVIIAPETLVAAGAIIPFKTEEKDVWVPAKSAKLQGRKSDEIKI
jgi:sugar O-acyltransferase (sialic acid O-acetyltransferase NeuD family)